MVADRPLPALLMSALARAGRGAARHLLPLVLAVAGAGCATSLPPDAEARALDGRLLRSPAPEPAAAAKLEADLAAARERLAAAPRDRDAAIWVARRLGYLGRFREAVDVLSETLAAHPGDAFVLRHRGHRWITLREFARAVQDLEQAARACRTVADAVEADGRPVAGRPPHSSLHYNVHYHLGLARFLAGDFEGAERAWLDCLAVVANDESRVAVVHWLWCVRMRRSDSAGAFAVAATIRPELDVVENTSYHQLCLLYAGVKRREQVEALAPRGGSAGSALAFGLAHHRLVTGDREAARRDLEALAQQDGWAAFGVIAAEVELRRWR